MHRLSGASLELPWPRGAITVPASNSIARRDRVPVPLWMRFRGFCGCHGGDGRVAPRPGILSPPRRVVSMSLVGSLVAMFCGSILGCLWPLVVQPLVTRYQVPGTRYQVPGVGARGRFGRGRSPRGGAETRLSRPGRGRRCLVGCPPAWEMGRLGALPRDPVLSQPGILC